MRGALEHYARYPLLPTKAGGNAGSQDHLSRRNDESYRTPMTVVDNAAEE